MGDGYAYELRSLLYEKQSGLCDICKTRLHIDRGKSNCNTYLQIDHIMPGDREQGVRGLCKKCNSRRGNLSGDRLINSIANRNTRLIDEHKTLVWRINDEVKCKILTPKEVALIRKSVIQTMNSVVGLWEGAT